MANEPTTDFASMRLKVDRPTVLKIVSPDGQDLLTIHTDGRWEFRDDAAPTEAAAVFVREVKRLIGQDYPPVQHGPGE